MKEGEPGVMMGWSATGQGRAMAIAVLGRQRWQALATASCTPRPEEVRTRVAESAVAFGVVPDAVDAVVPPLIAALLAG